MNGALFGTSNVIENFIHVVSCRRTTHKVHYKIGMVIFMFYYVITFVLSFFTVGAMYAAITVFLRV